MAGAAGCAACCQSLALRPPTLDEAEVRSIATSVCRYAPGAAHYHHTDSGIAERFRDYHGERCRYVEDWNRWLIYDGAKWAHDREGAVVLLVRNVVRKITDEANDIQPVEDTKEAEKEAESKRANIWSFARRSENNSRMAAALRVGRSELAALPEQFDADCRLFNCTNGTLDLGRDEFRPHKRTDYLTVTLPPKAEPG
jgi:putative DNA primase/helicase